jgi:hypothetical protein
VLNVETIRNVVKALGNKTHHNTVNGIVLRSVFVLHDGSLLAKATGYSRQMEIKWDKEPAASVFAEGIVIIHDKELWHLARGRLLNLYKRFGPDLYSQKDWRLQARDKE